MHSKGFTMIEMVFVLWIALFFTLCSFQAFHGTLQMDMNQIKELIHQAQFKAIMQAQNVFVEFDGSHLKIDDKDYVFKNLVCESISFHYNELGHISQANTISCFEGKKEHKIVFQLGSGWIRIE